MRDTEKTFNWIVDILRKNDVIFQVTGGLAAKVYGSSRPLNDIDIDILDERIYDIVPYVRENIVFGPARYEDERWDVLLMTLDHKSQEIDISGGYGLRICDAKTGRWYSCPTDFSRYEEHEVFGVRVPVIPREDLIKYKKMLVGEHQDIDIAAVEKSIKTNN